MKVKSKKVASILIVLVIALITAICTIFVKKVNNSKMQLNSEYLRAMSYAELTEEDSKVENSEYVKFSTFFTRDLDDDGNAEKLNGTCKNINATDMLYIDLNVLSNGTLKNGKITITGNNFNYSMSMIKDTVLKYNYISNDVKVIELNDVQAGTQKLILGKIIADIGNDTKNYSKVSTITLTGTHVSEDGNTETEINKTINVTVDWYGDVSASLYTYNTYNSTYYYDNLSGNTVSFSFYVNENEKELLLKDTIATCVIPELNGYAPTSVVCQNSEYNEETRTLTITRSSQIDENGIITSSLSRSNTFSVYVTYPEEAFEQITSYTRLTIPVTGKYVAYNNENDEFENPINSNIATGTATITFTETPPPSPPTGYTYDFDVAFANKKYVSKPSYRYVISKQDLLNLYDNEDYKANFEYTVNWYARKGNLGKVNSFIMSETKSDTDENYGDKFDQTIMEEYTANKGIYFSGADSMLGTDGTISVYNNDTNELIKVFTSEDWNTYNSTNPYKYSEPIKHIRVETSKPNISTSLGVYNVKELDAKKIVENYTKDQIKDVSMVYTYLTGIADVEGSGKSTVKDSDYAYYVSEVSYANISLETNKISTQETVNEKIYISTEVTQTGDAKWKNGEFLVEVPEEIVNMEINSVTVDNSNVKVVAYDLYEKDGKYLLKIITENETPDTFKITIDTNMTPDPRISTTTKTFKLYAYNEYCNDYYYTTKDIYDVDRDNNSEENVGTSSTNLELLSPTSLITLETVSDYNEQKEITIAPNVALVERETRQAKINISVINNYPNTVNGVKILGKIPFEGNTYIINGKDLKSEFTTTMTSNGINNSDDNPTDVKEKTVIYYSENENPSQDVTDPANGWMLLEDVKDFSKIKTYLIYLKDNEIGVGKGVKFDYDINLPENISYNMASFSNHAVYYNLSTDGGNLSLSTEPNKVGVRIVKKFDLELTKYKVNSNITIPGVTYVLKYKEQTPEGILEDKTRILTTDDEGKIILNNLLAETDYILQEIKAPNTCELNDEEISFKINEDLSVTINGDVRKYEFTTGETLKLELEDEIKYNVEINKTKIGSNIPINNVRFLLQDEEGNKNQVRTQNGICVLEGLSLNKVYTISEAVVPGNCELNDGVFKFKLVRNNDVLELVTIENSLVSGIPSIEDLESELTPALKLNVQNEIRYSLNLTKQDLEGNKIGGAKFTVKGEGFATEGTKYTTSRDGKISVSGLLVGRNYTIEEIQAIGYYLDSEKVNNIQFRVDRIDGILQITTWTVGDGIIQSGTETISEQSLTAEINVTLENEKVPTYNLKIVKQNDEGEILPDAQFKLTSLDTGAEEIITIGESGEGLFENLYEFIDGKCVTGEYTLQEIYAPEGYVVNKNILKFKGTKNAEGKVEITLLDGSELIKLDEETSMPLITCTENDTTFTIMNEPVFSLKKYGDNNSILPNAKFVITDLNGNQVTDVNGQVVGTEETINGNTYKVVTTNEKGEITADLPEGLYKVVEVAAPEGYKLAENVDDRTYYFGVGASRPVETSGIVDNIKWAKSVKSKLSSEFCDAVATDDGGSIAVGKAEVNIDIDGDGIPDGIAKGNKDGIIVKYDSEGNIEWSKIIGGINDDEIYGITKVPTGGYVLVGYSSTSEVYYDKTLIDVANYGNEDGIIIKIDENGNYLWSQCIGGDKIDEITDVAVSEDGDIAVVGSYYSSPIYMDKEKTESLTNRGNQDSFISVYSSDGVYSWSQNIGGTSDVYAKSVISTSNGFVVGVNFLGTVYVDTAGTTSVASKGNADGIIIGYSKEGDYSFSKQIGGTANDTISDVILVNDNETEGQKDIIVVGGYASSIDINADGTNDLTTKGGYDGMVVKFTESGDYIKSLSIGGSSDDTISTIIGTQDGGLLFGGWTYSSTVDLNKDGTNDITSNSGISDGLIAKLNAEDELEWFDSIKGSSYDKVSKVLQAEDGNFIAVGDYESSTLTAMKKAGVLTNSKFKDAFIIKYAETETTAAIPEMQRISITNDLIKYKITTEIAPNSEGVRTGGTITGEYSDLYPEENNIRFVEHVKYGYDNARNIIIQSSIDYEITKVTINGEEINIKPDENGKITLPAGYFENMQEDKHIVVSFVNKNHSLTIDKQDEEGNKLPGVTFEITTNNDTPEFGVLQENGATYIEPDETKEVTYNFTESEGTYTSNNQNKDNTVANSYIPLDLTNYGGEYELKINAQISSEGNDYGYVNITNSQTAPSYSSTIGRLIRISGNVSAKDYTTVLKGGNIYYIHLGYYKNASTSSGDDTFKINSISVTPVIKTYTVTTGNEGTVTTELDYSKYTIKEIEVPEHYVLLDEIVETEITTDDGNKTVVIVNKKKPQIIVHHYLKDGDTYTTTKLAEDEIIEGVIEEDYTTSPKTDLENYILEKNSNGDYVIPINATGKFTDGVQEIFYYYEEKPVTLTVHHYLEETEDKLTEDIVESLKKESTYETVASEDVLKDYELVSVDGTTEGTITEDTVVIYYYKKKVHNITTEVISHEEQRTDTLLNQKVLVQAFGGTITGEYTENYKEEDNIKFVEEVEQKEDSIAEITATPNAGYKVKLIKLISTSETGTKTETVIFGTDASDTAEISYTQNADGSVTLTTFEEVIEDKHIQVEFEPLEGTVITHHIIRGEDTDYQTLTKSDLVGEPYQTGNIDIEHYKLVETSDNVAGTYEEDVTHVYYYYDKENYIYSVHYFYDGVEDTTKTDKFLAEWQSKVTTYTDKNMPGYKFEKVEPLNDEENLELIISDNADNNVINVYYVGDIFEYKIEHYYEDIVTHEYVKDETLTDEKTAKYNDVINITDEDKKVKTGYEYERADNSPLTISYVVEDNIIKLYYGLADFSYSVHYFYDGVEDTDKVETSEAEFASKITEYTDKNIPGYKFERVEPLNDEENLELTISENADENIINVYYSRDIFGYKIEHYYENPITHKYEKDETLTDEKTAMLKDVINITDEDKKVKTGYEYERADNSPLTISYVVEDNIIKLYYGLADFSYSVHYFYDGVEDTDKVETSDAEFASKITEYTDKNIPGYKFEKVEPLNESGTLELTISEDSNNNVINVYYVKDDFEYTVHYFYDGVEDTSKVETSDAEFASKITEYKDKVIPGYRLEKVTPLNEAGDLELTITENLENNVINVFYKTNYVITTDVIEHIENYKDGTVIQNVKGGSISGEDQEPFENVFKGDSSKKQIKIVPSKIESGNENEQDIEYEIVKIVIKDGKQDKNGTELDLSKLIDKDGNVVLPEGYFENMQSDKHIEVEFRRKTKVIVKHLEEGTEKVLYETEDGKDYEEIIGYEGKDFETTRRVITNYQASDLGITDENKAEVNANGTMFADVSTIIYWYERIPSGIVVKHIEIDEQEITDGLTLESGILLEEETINGNAGLKETTKRKTYENYIAVDGPESTDSNIVIVGKADNSKDVTYLADNVLEIRYYYEKQYNITTDVKEHKELVNGTEINVKGGTISGEDLEPYENILNRGNNEKTIEIVPKDGYRVKSLTVNEKEIVVKDLENEDHKVILPKAYFTDVKENKHIVVEFEKIPAKVIIKYIDKDTNESIVLDKVVDGFVNDDYNEPRVLVDSYIATAPEPENSKGSMTEEDITVVYYYTKEFKITTDVKEHLEDKEKNVVEVIVDKVNEIVQSADTAGDKNAAGTNSSGNNSNMNDDNTNIAEDASTAKDNNTENTTEGSENNASGKTNTGNTGTENTDSKEDSTNGKPNTENTTHDILTPLNPNEIPEGKIAVKGGTITGEDETPYESVLRGENSKKQIKIIPDEGYRIKYLAIKDGQTEYTLHVAELLTKENTIILPEEYFKNMQADKHIVVEFEPIPARVVVNYLDIETKDTDTEEPKEVAKQEIGEGFVNYEYKTHEKEVPYYELVKEELPENSEGKLTKEDTVVNYWYRKLLFNMKITKEFSSIKVNENEILDNDKKFVKIDIANTDVANTNISVKYKLAVTNTEEVDGNATIVEHIPVGFKLSTQVVKVDNVAETGNEGANETQNPNTYDTWQEKDGEITLTTRNLKPGETAEYEVELEWDKSLDCIGSLVNTATITQTQNIPEYEETTLEDNTDSCTLLLAIRTRENRDVKTIISISCFVLAGICTVFYIGTEIYARRKNK